MSKPVAIEDTTFDKVVLQAKTPMLVDFWAPWCGPCRMVAPVLDELAKDYDGKIDFGKVNVDENPKIASAYSVQSIPTLILFKDGRPVYNVVGFKPKAELKKGLDGALGF